MSFSKTLFYSSTPLPQNPAPSLLSSLDPSGVVRCAVCKDQITPLVEAKQLPCKHLYHSDWIMFRLEEEEEEGGDDVMTKIRMEIIARLTKEDFYGLRTALNHISSCHTLIEEN
ncbi:hypothetical protein HKD37_09G025567 [Glycine soja]